MSTPSYDCIIVGSGPAGASAAYHLAKDGLVSGMAIKNCTQIMPCWPEKRLVSLIP